MATLASIVGSPGAGLAYNFDNGVLSVVSTGAYATNSTPTNVNATSPLSAQNAGYEHTHACVAVRLYRLGAAIADQ